MNRRVIFGLLALVLLALVATGIGTAVYNAGVSAGLSDAARQAVASGQPVPAAPFGYGYGPYWHGGWGFGFGFFGIFFWILGIFLIIGLLRGAMGWGRWGGGPRGGRSERIEEWHRELHRREGDGPTSGGQRAGA